MKVSWKQQISEFITGDQDLAGEAFVISLKKGSLFRISECLNFLSFLPTEDTAGRGLRL